jgi:hypothetical protein
VCSITHGAILLAFARNAGKLPWVTAREEWMAPIAATAVAKRNNELKIRRPADGLNVDVEFGFGFGVVIIELLVRWWCRCKRTPDLLLPKTPNNRQLFSRDFCNLRFGDG